MRLWLPPVLALLLGASASADPRQEYDAFREAMNRHAGGPTGMYAIQDATVIAPGKSARLVAAARPADARWGADAGKPEATTRLEYRDGRAWLHAPGREPVDLLRAPEQQQALGNGLIVRATVYEDSIKAWLYNPALSQQRFRELSFFPYDASGVVEGKFQRKPVPVGVSHLDSRNHTGLMYWVGDVDLPLRGKTYRLRAYHKEKDWAKIDAVLLFLTDRTSAKTSYGGGRVLEARFAKGQPPAAMRFNLNTLYAFLCAHSDYYNCPIKLTTRLDTALESGEKYPPALK